MTKRVTTAEAYKLLKELKEHLYGDQWGAEGDIPEIKTHLEKLNGTVRENSKDTADLPCKQGQMFGCMSRKTLLKWFLIIIIILSGGSVGLDRVVELFGG